MVSVVNRNTLAVSQDGRVATFWNAQSEIRAYVGFHSTYETGNFSEFQNPFREYTIGLQVHAGVIPQLRWCKTCVVGVVATAEVIPDVSAAGRFGALFGVALPRFTQSGFSAGVANGNRNFRIEAGRGMRWIVPGSVTHFRNPGSFALGTAAALGYTAPGFTAGAVNFLGASYYKYFTPDTIAEWRAFVRARCAR